MLSFIIIGRNEGWKLTKCLQSVFDTINQNGLKQYEVIYVDSKSTDDSLERAQKFNNIKVYQLRGDMNAAIARNIGAEESKGDVLFFIDGDMEIQPEFLPLVYEENQGLNNDFVSGNWENYYYDKHDNLLYREIQYKIDHDILENTTGGLFLIKKNIWTQVRGMNTIFKKSQDIDLGLRLAKMGVHLYRKKELAAKHHTVNYLSQQRIWKDFFTGNHLYGRSLLYRKNILNKSMYSRFLRNDYSVVLLVTVILAAILSTRILFYDGIIYILLLLIKSIKKSRGNMLQVLNFMTFFFLRDVTVLLGFFVFFPKKKKLFYESV